MLRFTAFLFLYFISITNAFSQEYYNNVTIGTAELLLPQINGFESKRDVFNEKEILYQRNIRTNFTVAVNFSLWEHSREGSSIYNRPSDSNYVGKLISRANYYYISIQGGYKIYPDHYKRCSIGAEIGVTRSSGENAYLTSWWRAPGGLGAVGTANLLQQNYWGPIYKIYTNYTIFHKRIGVGVEATARYFNTLGWEFNVGGEVGINF